MMDLVFGVVAIGAAAGLGALLLRVARAMPPDPRDRLLWMVTAGVGAWGMVGLALAAMHLLRPAWIVTIGLGVVAAGGRDVTRALGAVRWRWPRRPLLAVAPALVLCALAVVVLSPVVTGDQSKYQLAYPKLYAEAGGLVPTPWTFWGNQQFSQNFVFALAYAVRGETLALVLNALWLPLAAVSLARLVDRHLWRGLGGVAAALFVTLPIAWTLASKGGADLALVAYTALAVGALLDWRRTQSGGALRRMALASGLAAATKVMGWLVPALVGCALLVVAATRIRATGVVRQAVVFGLLAGAIAAPPYVRNAVETGNPLHPFAVGVFGGANWSVEAGRYLDEYYAQYRADRARRRRGAPYGGFDLAWFPWDATMTPESFERAARQSLDVGPFTLAFLPGAVWLAWRRRPARWALGLGGAYATVIAAGAWAHPRYVLPGVALILATAVAGSRRIAGWWLPAVVGVTLVGQLAVTSRLVLPEFGDQVRVATGRLAPADYLERHSARHRFWRRACPVIGSDGRVMVLEKIPHPYFIACPFVLASYLEQAMIDYRAIEGWPQLADRARTLGVTHVAIGRADLDRHADPYERRVTGLWAAWASALGAPVVETEAYDLYALAPATEGAPR